MLHVASERFLVLTAVVGLQRDRSDGSRKLENQKDWLPAIDLPTPHPDDQNNGERNKKLNFSSG